MKLHEGPYSFEWDLGNREKNLRRHGVTDEECEEVFFDAGKRILKDVVHSGNEERYILVGQTKADRWLFLVFTVRHRRLRVISARDLSRKERRKLL